MENRLLLNSIHAAHIFLCSPKRLSSTRKFPLREIDPCVSALVRVLVVLLYMLLLGSIVAVVLEPTTLGLNLSSSLIPRRSAIRLVFVRQPASQQQQLLLLPPPAFFHYECSSRCGQKARPSEPHGSESRYRARRSLSFRQEREINC